MTFDEYLTSKEVSQEFDRKSFPIFLDVNY